MCDKKNLPWFVVRYDFYPTRCVFSIRSPKTHNTLDKNHIQPQTMEDPMI